jgi:hypothetical protein
MINLSIDNLIVGKFYMLGSTNKYLGKLIKKLEIRDYREEKVMIAYFTNEKEEKTSINRWYNFDYNNSNKNIENIFIETTEKIINLICNCGIPFSDH